MRLEFLETDGGWAEILASPTDFDANPPVNRLRICWPLGEANVDRTAVGASLVFAPWIAGRCDHLRPFSALTEQRIVEWFQSQRVWVAPNPIRAGGLPLPRGTKRITLGSATLPDCATLDFVPSEEGSGTSGNSIRVATNLAVLLNHAGRPRMKFNMRLGAAVLLADSLSANEIVDPEFASEFPQDFSRAARLLEAVALGLSDE